MVDVSDAIVVEVFHPDGAPVGLLELGFEFLERMGIPNTKWERPLRIEVPGKISKAGNVYFDFSMTGIPLPEGIDTFVTVESASVEFGSERLSSSGNPTKRGHATFDYRGSLYEATVYLTKGKRGTFIKVHAHRSSGRPERDAVRFV